MTDPKTTDTQEEILRRAVEMENILLDALAQSPHPYAPPRALDLWEVRGITNHRDKLT